MLRQTVLNLIEQSKVPKIKLERVVKAMGLKEAEGVATTAQVKAVLDSLADEGLITLPPKRSRSQWNSEGLPLYIEQAKTERMTNVFECDCPSCCWVRPGMTLSDVRARAPWKGKMLGVGPSLALNRKRLHQALVVNRFMAEPAEDMLPINERALQLFGYEKELKTIHKVGLYNGQITVSDLRSFHVPEPLQGVRWPIKPSSGSVLIIENSTTFYSAWKANELTGAYACVVFGRGKMIAGAGLATDSLEQIRKEAADRANMAHLPSLHYFGDIDYVGAEIPIAVNKLRISEGLPPIEIAHSLYAALLEYPEQSPEHPWPKSLKEEDLQDLFGDLSEQVLAVFRADKRLAQEYIKQADFVLANSP